ncbi:MAG: hypothetical protein QOH88_1766 [Verrucomicrobiota bacterium]
MKNPASETAQIAETLTDLSVHLADVRMPVSDLAGGVLVVGQTSAGKTRSIVNNLARQFAEMFTRSAKSIREQRQFAMVYLGLKGRGHLDFVESLTKSRRKDVITISNGLPVRGSLDSSKEVVGQLVMSCRLPLLDS